MICRLFFCLIGIDESIHNYRRGTSSFYQRCSSRILETQNNVLVCNKIMVCFKQKQINKKEATEICENLHLSNNFLGFSY